MSVDLSFKACTFSAARVLKKEDEIGLVKEGYKADLLFWDIESIDEIPYWLGSDRILSVMKNGELIS